MTTIEHIKKIDERMPGFFSDLKELLKDEKSGYSKYRIIEKYFWDRMLSDKSNKDYFEDIELKYYFGLYDYLNLVCDDFDLNSISSFSDLLSTTIEDIGEESVEYLASQIPIKKEYLFPEIKQPEEREKNVSDNNRYDLEKEFEESFPVKPLIRSVADYYENLVYLNYEISSIPGKLILKDMVHEKLIETFNLLFDQGVLIVNGQIINISDCYDYSRREKRIVPIDEKNDAISSIVFSLMTSKVIYSLYDYYLSNPCEERLKCFIMHLLFHLSLQAFDGTSDKYMAGPNYILHKFLKDDKWKEFTGILAQLKTNLEYDDIKSMSVDEICGKIDEKIQAFFDTYVISKDIDYTKSVLRGFDDIVDEVYKDGNNAFVSLTDKDFLLTETPKVRFLAGKYLEDKNSVKAPTENLNLDIVLTNGDYFEGRDDGYEHGMKLVNDFLLDFDMDYSVDKMDTSDNTDNQNTTLDIVKRSELYSGEKRNDSLDDTKYIISTMWEGAEGYIPPAQKTHEEYIQIVKDQVRSNITNFLANRLSYIDNNVKDAAYVLEDLYYLSFVWGIVESNDDTCYEFECIKWIPSYQSRVYSRSKRKEIEEGYRKESPEGREIKEEIDSLQQINNRKNEVLRIIKDFTESVNKVDDFERLNEYKQNALEEILNLNLDEDEQETVEEILSMFADATERLLLLNDENKEELLAVERYVSGKIGDFKAKACKSLVTTDYYDSAIEEVKDYLTSGEILFQQFVKRSEGKVLSDYGCIALEYYRAVEFMANRILYKPYFEAKLKERVVNNIDKEIDFAGKNAQYLLRRNRKYKNTLEYGTLAGFLSSVDKVSEANAFFSKNGINVNKLVAFAKKMGKTGESRNNCAHPRINTCQDALNARRWTYDSEDYVDEIRELLFELFDIFE